MFEILSLPSQHKSINKQFKTLRIMNLENIVKYLESKLNDTEWKVDTKINEKKQSSGTLT